MLLAITTVLMFLSMFLITVVILNLFESKRNLVSRLDSITNIDRRKSGKKRKINKNSKKVIGLSKNLNIDLLEILAGKLRQANIDMSSTNFVSILVSSAFVIGIIFGYLSKSIMYGFIGFIATIAIVKIILERIIKKRKAKFEQQLNEGTALIISALQSGYSFFQSLKIAAEDTSDPFSTELKYLLKEINLGMPMETGLDNLLKRTGSQNLKLIVNAVLIQKDVGGNLSEILSNIIDTIRERQRLSQELNTLTAQGRFSGMVVMLLPVMMALIIFIINKPYIMVLVETRIGNILILISLVSEFIGWILIKKIVDIEM